MPGTARRRHGEIQRSIFEVLLEKPDGLPVLDVLSRAEALLPPTPDEAQDYPHQPGVRRYPRKQRFATITSVKAGWLVKAKGVWRLTDEGRAAYETYGDPDEFERESRLRYQQWQADQTPTVSDPEEEAEDAEAARLETAQDRRRAWLVRGANVSGVNLVPQWLDEGFCSIQWIELPDIPAGTPRIDISHLVDEGFPELSTRARAAFVGSLQRFINDISVGDVVVTVDKGKVYVGEITGDPEFTGQPLITRCRRVAWANAASPFRRTELSPSAAAGLRGRLAVTELTKHVAEFARRAGLDDEDEILTPEVLIPAPAQELADELLLPLEWLTETVDLLDDKRQIVLYGPPGTGKTYLAQALCKALVEPAGGEYEVVQFHPSYAYEDFFEGLRPRLDGGEVGGIAFDLVPGPLRRVAQLAAENPASPYVLIIDEINRANLAKVFGELYFLLEYRDTEVALQYSEEPFSLPRNLFLIGTMNTADRSIALVDAAMRRRFYFQKLFPTEAPIQGLLEAWLARKGLPAEPGVLLKALNERIGDPDFAIGPSYLMTPRVASEAGLQRIWRTAILPLLEEHYFGEGRDIEAEFGLDALRAAGPQGDGAT